MSETEPKPNTEPEATEPIEIPSEPSVDDPVPAPVKQDRVISRHPLQRKQDPVTYEMLWAEWGYRVIFGVIGIFLAMCWRD